MKDLIFEIIEAFRFSQQSREGRVSVAVRKKKKMQPQMAP